MWMADSYEGAIHLTTIPKIGDEVRLTIDGVSQVLTLESAPDYGEASFGAESDTGGVYFEEDVIFAFVIAGEGATEGDHIIKVELL